MRRALTVLFMVAAVLAAIVIAEQQGHVSVLWQGWRIDTSVPVALAALLVAIVVAGLVFALLRLVLLGPGALLRRRRERRRRAGYRALTQGMVAVAAGDAEEAARQAKKADVLLAEPPLTLLLSAQAAQLNGDEDAARNYFSAMLSRGETEFLGLRGLLTQALKRGDEATALRLAERAHALHPRSHWVLTNLFELRTRRGEWAAAAASLGEAAKAKLLPADTSRRHQAALLHERSKEAEEAGNAAEALQLAGKAQDLAPDFAPAIARHALLLHGAGRDRAAAKAIEAGWRRAPHPLLAETYGRLFASEPPLARMKRMTALAGGNSAHLESHIMLARAALEAKLWGEARRHLQAAGASANGNPEGARPEQRLCRLMAELEEAEHGDGAAARTWLAKAAEAPRPPLYLCSACETECLDWQPLCPHCSAFDSLEWRTPRRAFTALPATPTARLPAPVAPPQAPPPPAPLQPAIDDIPTIDARAG